VSALFVMTLCQLTRVYSSRSAYEPKHMAAENRAHVGICDAIVAGDAALASRRMITHLRASQEFAENSSRVTPAPPPAPRRTARPAR
jgi:DNA-binding FadR family transcriptional regulator